MELRQMQYFVSIIDNNSFSIAAEENYISQSAISQQIQALEKELGYDLIVRKNRKFNLTQAGEYFYKESKKILSDIISETNEEYLRRANAVCPVTVIQNRYSMIARDHEKLFWMICKKGFIVPIPGSRKIENMESNFEAGNVVLTQEEIEKIDNLLDTINVPVFGGHK